MTYKGIYIYLISRCKNFDPNNFASTCNLKRAAMQWTIVHVQIKLHTVVNQHECKEQLCMTAQQNSPKKAFDGRYYEKLDWSHQPVTADIALLSTYMPPYNNIHYNMDTIGYLSTKPYYRGILSSQVLKHASSHKPHPQISGAHLHHWNDSD